MSAAFIARQPIFDRNLKVVGYELLFRGRGYAADALIDNPEQATATVLLNAVTELDLKRVVGNKTAWINVSREFVLGDAQGIVTTNGLFRPFALVDGRAAGTWAMPNGRVDLRLWEEPSADVQAALAADAAAVEAFMRLETRRGYR